MSPAGGPTPKRGEVWLVDFRPGRATEVSDKERPALVVSTDEFNRTSRRWATVLPITTNLQPVAARVRVNPPEGGQTKPGMIMCDQVRTLTITDRFKHLRGAVSLDTMRRVEERLALVLGLQSERPYPN